MIPYQTEVISLLFFIIFGFSSVVGIGSTSQLFIDANLISYVVDHIPSSLKV